LTFVNDRKRVCKAINTRVDTRRPGNECELDAKAAAATLLAGVLFEDVNG
jgi:hypothetical protein